MKALGMAGRRTADRVERARPRASLGETMNGVDPPRFRDMHVLGDAIDFEAALRRLGGDNQLFDQIVEIALEDAPNLVHSARQALAEGNAQELRRAAHSLKSLMATLGATSAANSAMRVEHAAAGGNMAAAGDAIHSCGEQVAEICRTLQAYCDSGGAAEVRRP
jgi:HPt (histidine-containing phosphotransfer) domain-containing protein